MGFNEDILAAIDATIRDFDEGDIVEGRVVKVDREEALLDIGYRTEGVISSTELSFQHHGDARDVVSVGDVIRALVLQKEDHEGRLILSKKRAEGRAWEALKRIKDQGGVVSGTVIDVAKDGLILDIGVRAMVPNELIETRRVRNLQQYLGAELEAKIIEIDTRRRTVVLSRRAWLEESAEADARATEIEDLRRQLDRHVQEQARTANELDGLRKQVADDASELAELQATADRHIAAAEQARNVARALWATMSPEGRLAYFESGSNWLPQWIVQKED